MDTTGSTGILIQQVANIHFFSTKWHCTSYINLTIIEENHSLLRNLIQDLQYMCKDSRRILKKKIMDFDIICDPIRNKLVYYMQDLDKLNYLFYYISRPLSKTYFSEENAYDHALNYVSQIKNSPKIIFDDTQNSTSYFQNWFNLQNTASENFKGHLELLQDEITSLQIEVTALNNSEKINFILDPVLRRFQKSLIFILALIEKHYINLISLQKIFVSGINYVDFEYFVPIAQFKNLLFHINTKLSHSGTKLIIDPHSHEIRKYYKLLNIDTFFSRNIVFFQITVPLIQNENYTFFKAVPLPIRLTQNVFAFIVPQHTHFALNMKENTMIPLTLGDFLNCIQYNKKYYCEEISIMYNTAEKRICEVEAIRTLEAPAFCNYRLVQANYDIFFPLYAPNTWSYTSIHQSSITAQCEPFPAFSLSIPNQGIIDIPSDCNFQINGFYINAQKHIMKNELRFIIPKYLNYEVKAKMLKIDHLHIDNVPFFEVPLHQRNDKDILIIGSLNLNEVISEKVMISYRYSIFEIIIFTFSFIVACALSPYVVFKYLKCWLGYDQSDRSDSDSYRDLRTENLLADTHLIDTVV